MKYISLDIETTGLAKDNKVLQLAMVYEDTKLTKDIPVEELPFFNVYVHHNSFPAEPYAMIMHAKSGLLQKVMDSRTHEWQFQRQADIWLSEIIGDNKITVAGKNVAGFDLQFLPELAYRFYHRVIDAGCVFIDFDKDTLPSLDELIDTEVRHDALEDARDVIRILRRKYT